MKENTAQFITTPIARHSHTRDSRVVSTPKKRRMMLGTYRAGNNSRPSPRVPNVPSHRKRKIAAPHNAPERALVSDNGELGLFNICPFQFVYYLSEPTPCPTLSPSPRLIAAN